MLRVLKALPTVMRVGLAEAIAYRAEMIVWVFSTTMPFVMLALWSAVSEAAPVTSLNGKRWGSEDFVTYFLVMFVVRQLVSSWAAWEINFDVRQGTLSMRLLRPIHPVIAYAASNLAAMPLRAAVTLPVMVVVLATSAGDGLSREPWAWALFVWAMFAGWLITFFANILIGALCFFMESSTKVLDVWIVLFFVFSGYLFPAELAPGWLNTIAGWLPFRFQVGLPVEVLTGRHSLDEALMLCGRQLMWAGGFALLALSVWRWGVRRFQAYGG